MHHVIRVALSTLALAGILVLPFMLMRSGLLPDCVSPSVQLIYAYPSQLIKEVTAGQALIPHLLAEVYLLWLCTIALLIQPILIVYCWRVRPCSFF